MFWGGPIGNSLYIQSRHINEAREAAHHILGKVTDCRWSFLHLDDCVSWCLCKNHHAIATWLWVFLPYCHFIFLVLYLSSALLYPFLPVPFSSLLPPFKWHVCTILFPLCISRHTPCIFSVILGFAVGLNIISNSPPHTHLFPFLEKCKPFSTLHFANIVLPTRKPFSGMLEVLAEPFKLTVNMAHSLVTFVVTLII